MNLGSPFVNVDHPPSSMAGSPGCRPRMDSELGPAGFSSLHEDLVANILGRLPAVSFASAASVSKTWQRVCDRILCRPKLASHLSVKWDTKGALDEVIDNVLSEPIRPHFAIASVDSRVSLEEVLVFLTSKLGSKTPIIVSHNEGIIGRDANCSVKEMNWGDEVPVDDDGEIMNHGIVLTVGFVPGLKVDAIPLVRFRKKESSLVDEFINDIQDYAASVSGQPVPVGIMMFGDSSCDLQFVVEKLDYAMPKETAVVGDQRCQFMYQSADHVRNACQRNRNFMINAVALTFARDRDHNPGSRTIKFHVALAEGVSALGPVYKAASVRVHDRGTWITARREGDQEIHDGQRILNEINVELENHIGQPELYVKVRKRRKYAIGSENAQMMTSLSFHSVTGGDEEYLYLDGVGIKTGDQFQFAISDATSALSCCGRVSASLNSLKSGDKSEFFGGFLFTCVGRGGLFFVNLYKVDSSPFTDNFPEVPVAGVYCGGEIGRRTARLDDSESEDRCCSHVYSAVYLVMEYS